MRPIPRPTFALALAAGALLCTAPVLAQQAAPAAVPPVSAPAAVPLTPAPVAPLTAAPPILVLPPGYLSVPTPPGGTLRFEMNASSEDLLGLMKSFLKGIGETRSPNDPTRNPNDPAYTRTPRPNNPIEQALTDGNLADILKDVNHVHFLVWELTPPPAPPAIQAVRPHVNGAKFLPAPPAPAVPKFDANSFYEGAFGAEGAHRILFTDVDDYKLVMVGFPDRRGFAFAASGGGYVAAARSDGYPDLEALTAFISRVTSAVAQTQTGKKILHDTVNDNTPGSHPRPSRDKDGPEDTDGTHKDTGSGE